MRRLLVASLILGFVLSTVARDPLAQENEEEMPEYAWGIIHSISTDKIVITEHDYDSEEDINVTYSISSAAVINNAKSLKDIKVGDEVEIEYIVDGGNYIARALTVEQNADIYEEEATLTETFEDETEYPEEVDQEDKQNDDYEYSPEEQRYQ